MLRLRFYVAAAFLLLLGGGCDSNAPLSIEVVHYDGDPITTAMNSGWTATVDGAIVTLITLYEDSTLDQRLVLLDVGADLPTYGGFSNYAPGEERPFTLQEGTIAIQSFDVSGEISGTLSGKTWRRPVDAGGRVSSVFWVNMSLGGDSDSSQWIQ